MTVDMVLFPFSDHRADLDMGLPSAKTSRTSEISLPPGTTGDLAADTAASIRLEEDGESVHKGVMLWLLQVGGDGLVDLKSSSAVRHALANAARSGERKIDCL